MTYQPTSSADENSIIKSANDIQTAAGINLNNAPVVLDYTQSSTLSGSRRYTINLPSDPPGNSTDLYVTKITDLQTTRDFDEFGLWASSPRQMKDPDGTDTSAPVESLNGVHIGRAPDIAAQNDMIRWPLLHDSVDELTIALTTTDTIQSGFRIVVYRIPLIGV